MTDQTKTHRRFVLVDALRGFAAVAVLIHHLLMRTYTGPNALDTMRGVMAQISHALSHGVEVFFVISGFVITHSLRNHRSSASEIGRFVLRRQVRLDPVYWVVLAVMLVLMAVQSLWLNGPGQSVPSVGAILANMFYVQRLAGMDSMLLVSWTLCIEIQFYLFFMAVLWVCHRTIPGDAVGATAWLMAGLGLGSLALFVESPPMLGVTMLPYWCYFVGGYLCYVGWIQRRQTRLALGYVALFAAGMAYRTNVALFAGLCTMLVIVSAAWLSRLTDWHCGRAVQYLGRISYSLYLIHVPVIAITLTAGPYVFDLSPMTNAGLVLFAGVASIPAADVLYRFVEMPAMRTAGKIRKRGG
jgi:peptidoglycan/LPS O-acetylase OafA/YrhL